MNPFAIAVKGKGILGMLKRADAIRKHYGVTASKMDHLLTHFVEILGQFNCGATFPITAAAVIGENGLLQKYQAQNIEFAVHGYYHIDHTRLSLEEQVAYLEKARLVLEEHGVTCSGFRCPYLRWNEDTLSAARQVGFSYDSSQGLAWDIVDEVKKDAYLRVLDFYGAVSADSYPALPRWDHHLVRLPYCLPDDEALVDRFRLKAAEPMNQLWLDILAGSYRLGELFTLGLHPERIDQCKTALLTTLERARELSPPVWIARLDEITRWWKARTESRVNILQNRGLAYRVSVNGPKGVTILARGIEMLTQCEPWDGIYQRATGTDICFRSGRRPFIGVSPSSAPYLTSFLRQQGYIVEPAEDDQNHVLYLHCPRFSYEDERPLLFQIEQGKFPFVRLCRWPDGARSALCITGDIDAITIWDYSRRLLRG